LPNAFEHNDGFEEFLKGATDSFSMTPHQSVWRSVYNNIHPQKRWPAVSTKIMILFCVIFLQGEHEIRKNIVVEKQVESTNFGLTQHKNATNTKQQNNSTSTQILIAQSANAITQNVLKNKVLKAVSAAESGIYAKELIPQQNLQEKKFAHLESEKMISEDFKISTRFLNEKMLLESSNKNEVNMDLMKKSASNFSLQFYATPGFGYQYNSEKNEVLGNTLLAVRSNNVNNEKKSFSAPTLNLEAGGAVTMNISKILRLKVGMQLNFTRFEDSKSESNNLSLTSQQSDLSTKIDMFQRENNLGITPDLYQLSVPIGTEIKIIGNEKIQWLAGATIQPSFLMNNTDLTANNEAAVNKNGAFALRRWNVNSSIETFLSYQVHPGVVLNVGPQLRYQLLSTFNREIPKGIDKLYNFGLKFGISRNF
jgi:hypothetical protein